MTVRKFGGVEQTLLEYVYREFKKTGGWPLARTVDIDLGDLLDSEGGLQFVCDAIGTDYISYNSPDNDTGEIALRIRAFELFPEAKHDLENFLGATRYFSRIYRETRGHEREVRLSDYATAAGLDAASTKRLDAVIHLDGRYWQGAGPGHYQLNAFAGKVGDVKTVDDYLARCAAYSERGSQRSRGKGGREGGHMRYVFLSHAAADTKLARYVGEVIRSSVGGVEVFVASNPGEIRTGDEWLASIKDQLRRADTYLVLLTPISVQRLWIWFETGAAWMSDRRLLPVTVGLDKNDIPMPLGAHQVLSLEDPDDVTQLFRDLRIAVSDVERFCAAVRDFRPANETESPGEIHVSKVNEALDGLRRATNAASRHELLRSSQGVRIARQAVKEVFRAITATVDRARADEPNLWLNVGNTDDQLVIQGLTHSISVVWDMKYGNSLNESELYVIDVEGRLALPKSLVPAGRTKHLEITHYDFSIDDDNHPVWVEVGTSVALAADRFAEVCVSRLIRHQYEDKSS